MKPSDRRRNRQNAENKKISVFSSGLKPETNGEYQPINKSKHKPSSTQIHSRRQVQV